MKKKINKINKCILWGIGNDYDLLLNQILFEIYKGNISVEALVCRKGDKYCLSKDGFPIIYKEELNELDFDYLIITSGAFYNEIRDEALRLGIQANQVIDGRKFLLPLFDFSRYSQLIHDPVTILSDDCWGGYAYNRLGLLFSSPLINIYWDREEYANFILNPLFYLSTELTLVQEGNLQAGIYPIGQLGNTERNVNLKFVHNANFTEAKLQWDRRIKRINVNNLFIKMGFTSSEKDKQLLLNSFENVPYNKILFYNGDEKIEGAFKTERFIWRQQQSKRIDYFNYNDFLRSSYYLDLDLLKLLTGDKNYSRENSKRLIGSFQY